MHMMFNNTRFGHQVFSSGVDPLQQRCSMEIFNIVRVKALCRHLLEDLTAVRASIPPSKWNAQYQQNPTGEENAIIPRQWWQKWEKDSIPNLEYVIQSYDTAFSKRETADFSAITTWGVFRPQEAGGPRHLFCWTVRRTGGIFRN